MDLALLAPFPRPKGEDEEFSDTLWSADGLHMTSDGYDFVGHELAATIYPLITAEGQPNVPNGQS